jgi:23S rRNA pseudouridine1911/1915/1917 synthase
MMTDVRKNYSRIVDSKSPGAQRASLAYQVVAEKQQFVCLDIQLYTGRHHQIRLQMAHIGCPLLGDQKYGTGSGRTTLALCSYRMSFSHPRTGKRMEYCMKPKNESFKNIFTDENE